MANTCQIDRKWLLQFKHMIQSGNSQSLPFGKLFHGLILLGFASRLRQICQNLIKKESGVIKE